MIFRPYPALSGYLALSGQSNATDKPHGTHIDPTAPPQDLPSSTPHLRFGYPFQYMFQGAEKCAEFVQAQFPVNVLHFSLGFPSTSFGMEFGTFFGTPKHTFGTKFGTQFGTRVETPLSQKRRQVL